MPDLCTLGAAKAWLKTGQAQEQKQVPAAPGPYTVTVSKATTWGGNGGVAYAAGGFLAPVTGTPATGQYKVVAGVYTFAAGDAGAQVVINYLTATPDDALIAALISAASGFIQDVYCCRQFAMDSFTEVRNGTGHDRIVVKNPPIVSVTGVTVNGLVVPASTGYASPSVTPSAGYLFSETEVGLIGYRFRRGFQNVVLAYDGGFATVPPAVVQACVDLVALRYTERGRIGQSGKSLKEQHTSYTTKDLTEPIRMVLNRYVRVAMP